MDPKFTRSKIASAIFAASLSMSAQSQVLEEVIVTAQKRAESLQDVPISVVAMQGDRIQDAGITDMEALADFVPNLHISKGTSNTFLFMRGMGSTNNQGFEQSVAMFLDGIYMGRGRQFRAGFFDVERVEVLRGPQGTLFGKNTIAGAVNMITASPVVGDETNGRISAAVETDDGLGFEGHIEGSLTDNFAARLAFNYRESDTTIENSLLDLADGAYEDSGARLTLVWEPNDSMLFNFKYSHTDFEREGQPGATWLYLDPESRDELYPNRSPFASVAYLVTDTWYPEIAKESRKDFTTYKDLGYGRSKADGAAPFVNPDSNDDEYDNALLNFEWDLGGHVLTSVTGWTEYSYVEGQEADWLPIRFIHVDVNQDFEQFSQELRITSPGGEFFDYIAGAYYETSELEDQRRVTQDATMDGLVGQTLGVESLLTLLSGGAYNANQIARTHNYQLDTDAWAVFGQGTFNLSDTLRLTLGLRYTEEEKEVTSPQFLSDDLVGLGTPNNDYLLGATWSTAFNTYARNYNEDRKTDKWLPSLNVQWDVGDNSMLYATFSQGFKSGGFTASQDGEPGDLDPGTWPCVPGEPIEACYDPTRPNDDFEFDDEEADAFEIGGKHTLFDGSMTLNWAAFYTEYDNLQVSIFKGVSFTVTNAAASEVMGLELDMAWQATENLFVGASASWLDAEYSDYENAPCTAIQLDADPLCGTDLGVSKNDLTGEPTNYAPEYSANLFLDYNRLIGNNGLEFFTGVDVNYRDWVHSSGDNDPLDELDSYTKVNARIGVRNESWELMLYGRNVFDEATRSYSFDVPVLTGSHGALQEDGQVWGARLSYNF